MAREEKKYEILPGTKTPDIKAIVNAASDFSNPGVEELDLKGAEFRKTLATESDQPVQVTSEEISKLKNLGIEVAESELRAQAESAKKMEEIKKQIIAPASIENLQKSASKFVSEEKREIIEKERAEKEAKLAEEEAKRQAREERRLAQQKALEETLAKKAVIEEEARKKAEAEEQLRKQKEEEQKKAEAKLLKEKQAAENAVKDAQAKKERDDDYKAWVRAKREEAIKKQAEAGKEKTEVGDSKKPAAEPSKEPEVKKDSNDQAMEDFSEFL